MTGPEAGCEGCPVQLVERRLFLRQAAVAAASALGGLAAVSHRAGALVVSETAGVGARSSKSYPIPAADGVAIDKGESVIIARFQSRVYAFSLACPHQNTALRWDARASRFQCPKHKSRYQPDGAFIDGRATRGMDRFAVRRDGDAVVVNFDVMYEEDKHAAEWAAAFVQL